ncbi:unnamed protein product [Notodromas monacha]|uniref:NIF3-like protein 1 n=1 Tax=Notodromas monacha TaxID=399045 RepID=A0A7R9GBC2_9CRUS|nr:unnamed protein product [Notodromas monacha]CAG0914855.1 unnamed protein product [Notodromas monacha]
MFISIETSLLSWSVLFRNARIMELSQLVKQFKRIAPLALAESWDNVGLLVQPPGKLVIKKVLLTNDFTEPVMQEALEANVNMVLTYHPLIFSGLKRITMDDWKTEIVSTCLRNNIAVYSPHTTWDSFRGGASDWLLDAFKKIGYAESYPLKPSSSEDCKITFIAGNKPRELQSPTSGVEGEGAHFEVNSDSTQLKCRKVDAFPAISAALRTGFQVSNVEEPDASNATGGGRWCTLKNPISLKTAVHCVKEHLHLEHVRVAKAVGKQGTEETVSRVGVCCGSGASTLPKGKLDVFVTGEMSHHDVLDAIHTGTHVILCDHSNTERGFLEKAKQMLEAVAEDVEFAISVRDADPLVIV